MHLPYVAALSLALSVTTAVPHRQRANVPCYQDNAFRALQRFSSEASSFCPKLLTSSAVPTPSNLAQYGRRITSACSCYEKTAGNIATTTTTPVAPPPGAPTPKTTTTTSPSKVQVISTPTSTPTTVAPATPPATTPTSMKTSTPIKKSATPSVPSSPAAAPTSIKAGGTAKRGLVYDYNSKSAYANFFVGSPYVSFGSNWGDTRVTGAGVTIPDSFAFVPTLTVDGSLNNNGWNDTVKAAIQSGSKYIFASNEPDNAGQANLSPSDAATVYKKYMQQFKGQALLATPAVTNGGGTTGLNYLDSFLTDCADCHFDMINIHHYVQRSDMDVDQAVAALKSYIETNVPALQAKHSNIQNIPIMVGEFWLWDCSLTEGGTYLQEIMPYLDSNPNIIGYQAFGGLWTGNFITSDGSGLTPAGTAYKSYYKAE